MDWLTLAGLPLRWRIAVARLLAAKGISAQPLYPDISTREKAAAVAQSFVEGKAPRLLP